MAMIICISASIAGLGLYAASTESKSIVLPLGAFYGAAAFTVYTLCVAHANDLVHKKRAVEVSSGLLLVFSMGAIIGPLIASFMMRELGHGALFLHSAMAHLGIALVMILRTQQRPKLPVERNEPFVSVPKTTPAVFDLDPRGERQGDPDQEDDDAASDGQRQAMPVPSLLPTRSNA
jgi:MFS family permease